MSTPTTSNKEEYLTISESVKLVRKSPIWLRRLLVADKSGKVVLEGKKDNEGHWLIKKSSLIKYKQESDKKEQERLQKLDEGITYNYVRPRAMSIQMVTKGLEGLTITKEELEVTKRVLKKLEDSWNKDYEQKKSKKN